ncbi:MAG: hypothetical protein QOI63_1738 [Thermoplasmata archaeon]|jgi:hypothetical protein|nr:hypothetical protein [Thermoplasmata archaeon]
MDTKTTRQESAIDPLALLLRSDIYVRLTLPDPAPESIRTHAREAVKGLTPREREQALEKVGNLVAFARALEHELRGSSSPEASAGNPQVRVR